MLDFKMHYDLNFETRPTSFTAYVRTINRTDINNVQKLAATLRGSRPGVQSASLYDNFCKTGNYVIYDVII